jgi:chromosomal replication initiator protein
MKATNIRPLGVVQTHTSKIMAIQGLVAGAFNLRSEDLSMSSRERAITIPRQIAMYLAKQETEASLMEIGSIFGGKHHTTVSHAISRIEELRRLDPATDRVIKILQNNLKSTTEPTTS